MHVYAFMHARFLTLGRSCPHACRDEINVEYIDRFNPGGGGGGGGGV